MGSNGVDEANVFGPDEDAEHAQWLEVEPLGSVTPFTLVDQDEVGFELKSQGNRFGFTSVEISPQCSDEWLFANGVDVNPWSVVDL
ncbi:MAG: hypothetical protein AAGD38_12470 [Acidobacteriota bacterium]